MILAMWENGMNIKQKRWAFVLGLSLMVSLLGIFNVLVSGPNFWLGWSVVAFFSPGVWVALIQMYQPRPHSKHRDGFVIKKSAWTAICYMIICASWLLGLMYMAVMRPDALWLITVLMFVCALGMLVSLWQFFDPRPITVINETGFYDRNLRIGTIPWSEITGASIAIVQGTEVISLRVTNPDLLARREVSDKLLGWLDQVVGFELLHLGLVKMDTKYMDEALDYVLARCAGHGEESQAEPTEFKGLMNLAN